MVYDDCDRRAVRDAVVTTTALAWLISIAAFAAGSGSPPIHVHASTTDSGVTAAASAVNWLLMLVAMMTPVVLDPIQFLRSQGLARRRAMSTVMFVASYAAVWMLAGAILLPLASAIDASGLSEIVRASVVVVVAVAWQCSPIKQVCLNHCHLRPALPAFGRPAVTGVLRFGATHALWCVGSCWTWMLAPMLALGGHTALMAAATLVVFCERLERPAAPGWRWRGLRTASRIVSERLRTHRDHRSESDLSRPEWPR